MSGIVFRQSVIVVLCFIIGVSAQAQTTMTTGTDWNTGGNWDSGVPSGAINAVVNSGISANVNSGSTPSYSGSLTLQSSATVTIQNNAADVNAISGSSIIMNTGSEVSMGNQANPLVLPAITMLGNAIMNNGPNNPSHHRTRDYSGAITGAGILTMEGNNNITVNLNVSNSFAELVLSKPDGRTNWRVDAEVAGALGWGDVTVEDTITLRIHAANAMDDSGALYLVGGRDTKLSGSYSKLHMTANDTIDKLFIDGFQALSGSYTSSESWLSGSGTLTVNTDPVDSTPPTVVSIVDNFGGGPIYEDISTVLFTVTFDEDIDAATVSAADFDNAGTAAATVGTITKTTASPAPAIYTVELLPTSTGTLILRIPAGATIDDALGNTLVVPVQDPDTITINAGSSPPSVITGTASGPGGSDDNWNNAANWDTGVIPVSSLSAIVSNGVTAQVDNASPPTYTGTLTISNNATVRINNTAGSESTVEGPSSITMHTGSKISLSCGFQIDFAAITLAGNAEFDNPSNAADHDTRNFNGVIDGAGTLILTGRNNNHFRLKAANTFTGDILCEAVDRWNLYFDVANAAGPGDVTINGRSGDERSARIYWQAANAMADTATLYFNGDGYDGNGGQRIIMTQSDTIFALFIDGVQLDGGTYTSADSFIQSGGGTLTVIDFPAGITNNSAVNEATTSADLVSTLDAPNEIFDIYAYWSTNDNADSTAWLADVAASNTLVGAYSNIVAITNSATDLTPATIYYYTMRASNALEEVWATPNASFVTPGVAAPPTVTVDGGATNVGIGAAQLRGLLTAGGAADAFICWGENDAGTSSTSDWENVTSVISAIEGVGFFTDISDLYFGIEYDYRIYVSNAVGIAWSGVDMFTTLPPESAPSVPVTAGLNAHYDAGVGITTDGSGVLTWEDQSGNGFTATRSAGTLTLVPSAVNSLPAVNFNNNTYANISGSMFSKQQFIVFNLFNSGDWGSVLGSQTRSGYLMNRAGYFWNSNYPTAVRQNGGSELSPNFQLSNIGNYMVLRITGNSSDPSVRTGWALGRQEGWDTPVMNLAEVISYDTTLSSGDEDLVGGYLAFKYGLTTGYPVYTPPASIAITNTAAANIAATSADLVGTLDATQSVFTVTAYYSTNNNASSAAWLADGDALSASAGTFTNVLGQSVQASVSSLVSQKTYYYAMRAVNASTNLWALPNASFTTLSPAVPPTVTVGGGVTDVGVGTATLRGLLTAGIFANASVYWGATDGGTSTSAWDNVIDAGVAAQGTTFSNAVSGLLYGIEYDYRVYVTNSAGEDWSGLDTFTTVAPPNLAGGILKLDFSQSTDTPLQSGWEGFSSGTDNGNPVVKTYVNSLATDGDVDVTVQGQSHWRDYAAITSGPFQPSSSLLSDEALCNNGSTIIITLADLTPGDYSMTTYHHASQNAGGTTYDLKLTDSIGADQTITAGMLSSGGTSPTSINTQQFDVVVNPASDDILVKVGPGGASGNHLVVNGFELQKATVLSLDLANTTASSVTDNSASLEGTLVATQSVFTVTAYYSTNNNADSTAWMADGSASSQVIDTYTNVVGQSLVAAVSGLDPLATYYYTLRASNAATNLWATPNASFTTFATQVAPTVDNAGGPTAVLDVSATLNGNMSAGGVATAYIVWGTSVPGSPLDTNAWANVETIGSVSDGTLFSTNVSGLAALTTYYYRCFVTNAVGGAWSVVTNFATTVAVNTMIAGTDWNTAGNWDKVHVPIGNENVIVGAGLTANVNSGSTPAYTGSLTLQNNVLLRLYSNSDLNALGGAAQTITMKAGSKILLRMGSGTIAQPFVLNGAATIQGGESTAGHHGTHNFTGIFSGLGSLAFRGVNNDTYQLRTNNTFNGLSTQAGAGSNYRVDAYAAGALGVGDVSITNSSSLRLFAADAIADVATLSLDGGRDTKLSATYDKLHVTVGNTVSNLYIDGLHKQAGVYDNTEAWLSGAGTLTVLDGPPPTAPEIDPSDFVDDVFGGPINEDHPYYPITYTLTFDRDMDDTTVEASDFENGGTATIAVGMVTETSDGVFDVLVTPSGSGTLILQITNNAVLKEAGGASLDTSSAIADDTTITIIAGSPPLTTISGTAGGTDSWNTSGNWDNGVPYGNQSAAVTAGLLVQVGGASRPYAGDLTFGAGSTLRVNAGTDVNVLPSAGGTITLLGSATFDMLDAPGWGSGFVIYPDVVLGGNLLIDNRGNGSHHETRVFSGAVSGTGGITMDSDNNNILRFSAANTFSGGVTMINANSYLEATADGALGIGSVTIGNSTSLKIGSGLSDSINDHASLNLNGTKDGGEAAKVVMGSSETIKRLYLDGTLQDRGTYGAISSGADNESATFSGSGILTVLNGPPRTIFLFK